MIGASLQLKRLPCERRCQEDGKISHQLGENIGEDTGDYRLFSNTYEKTLQTQQERKTSTSFKNVSTTSTDTSRKMIHRWQMSV